MGAQKKLFRLSVAAAAAVWLVLSCAIVAEVVESRKNTIAARPTGYIQQPLKEKLSGWQILAAEPAVVAKVFGVVLLDTAAVWGALWAAVFVLGFAARRLKAGAGP